jgi:hypothetical protein
MARDNNLPPVGNMEVVCILIDKLIFGRGGRLMVPPLVGWRGIDSPKPGGAQRSVCRKASSWQHQRRVSSEAVIVHRDTGDSRTVTSELVFPVIPYSIASVGNRVRN